MMANINQKHCMESSAIRAIPVYPQDPRIVMVLPGLSLDIPVNANSVRIAAIAGLTIFGTVVSVAAMMVWG